MSHRSQILHGLLARAPKTRAAFGVSSQLYICMIAGHILENSTPVACLATVGTVVKGWNDFKKIQF